MSKQFVKIDNMKKYVFLLALLSVSISVFSQERAHFELAVNKSPMGYVACNPIDPTHEQNVATIRLEAWEYSYHVFDGDSIIRIFFKGYNPGKEIVRHVTLKLKDNFGRYVYTFFDADCVIPHGGSAEEDIVLLDLRLPKAQLVAGTHTDSFVIESDGEPSQDSIYFKAYGSISEPNYLHPYPVVEVSSEIKNLAGSITNQDGQPVASAKIRLTNNKDTFEVKTDSNGQYFQRIRKMIWLDGRITAPGCASYFGNKFWNRGISINGTDTADAILTDVVHYKAGHRASIILPIMPDPTYGRYYKLVRREEVNVVYQREAYLYFEREYNPQANVPYVIFPERDFDIIAADFDMESLPDEVPFLLEYVNWNSQKEYSGIIGAYSNRTIFANSEAQHLFYVDESTPDNNQNVNPQNLSQGHSAAFRCYIRESDIQCNLVFEGETDAVSNLKIVPKDCLGMLFDLQGRPVQGSPKHGVYVQNGKKVMK